MKKFLLASCAFLLSIVASLAGDITSNLDTYQQIECSFKPISRGNRRDKDNEIRRGTPPHIRLENGTSSNWSGYASATSLQNPAKGSVTDVSGSWTVPHLSPTTGNNYSSIWVGIDGYLSNSVEQLGTEHDWSGGSQKNYAWFEMYPKGSFKIVGFPVNVGDSISAEVKYMGSNTFQLSIVNHTRNVYSVVPSTYTKSSTALRSSAEWIVEAPFSTQVLPLANFGTVAFNNCTATINGTKGPINSSHWANDPLTMATNSGVIKSLSSSLGSGGESFTVTWKHQ